MSNRTWARIFFIGCGWFLFNIIIRLITGDPWVFIDVALFALWFWCGNQRLNDVEEDAIAEAYPFDEEEDPETEVQMVLQRWLHSKAADSDGGWHLDEEDVEDLYRAANMETEYMEG